MGEYLQQVHWSKNKENQRRTSAKRITTTQGERAVAFPPKARRILFFKTKSTHAKQEISSAKLSRAQNDVENDSKNKAFALIKYLSRGILLPDKAIKKLD